MTTETERTALEMAREFLARVEMDTDALERDRSDVLQAVADALASAPSAPQSLSDAQRVVAKRLFEVIQRDMGLSMDEYDKLRDLLTELLEGR